MIVVERPGLRTTVQDAGRPGLAHLGVPCSGAVDGLSRRLANALVGNADDAAVLETTLTGPRLRFDVDAVVALAGAPGPAHVDGEPLPFGTSVRVCAGQRVDLGRAAAGLHAYLAVAGGFAVAAVLGSRSTDTLSGLGPPVVRAGDVLRVGSAPQAVAVAVAVVGRRLPADLRGCVLEAGRRPLRIIAGPRDDWLTQEASSLLYGSQFTVTPATDRIGVRLSGPILGRTHDGEADTEGMVTGAVQLPGDGSPIVLLADHAATGGYPVVAVLAGVDVPLLAQARPGTTLRFVEVSVDDARSASRQLEMEIAGLW
jgi:biotin-dependent carboxylase-like uncharacterized protein